MKNEIQPYLKVSRPANLLLVSLVVIITASFFDPFPNFWRVLLSVMTVVFMTSAGNTLNDMCDIEIDRINKPDRPLPSGKLTNDNARAFMIVMFVLSNLSALVLGFWSLIISLFIATPLLLWYAYKLRHIALVGNIVVAFLSALSFVYAAQAYGNISLGYIPAVFTFIISVAREIVKDLEDLEGDSAYDSKTLPVIIGEVPTRIIAAIIIIILLPVLPFPFINGLYGKWTLIVGMLGAVVPLIAVIVQLMQIKRKIDYHQLAIVLKVVMFLGLFAIFLGKF
ncbi:MAG: geranylgeranylglycerol-phosphate geranylgeranyltransferase [Candidatus Neomarinimicrobiota bacterium]|jgi:geranylgeranylglycerol-phosphate geranylgeranyltransferase